MTDGIVRESNGSLFLVQPIHVEGSSGISRTYRAFVDTGFTGQLAIPATHCAELGLEYVRKTHALFGNARLEEIALYRADVFWGGSWRNVSVLATGTEVLIGMNMLRGSNVCFDAVDMGAIEIEPLSSADE